VIKDKPRTFKKKDIFFFSEAISRRKGKITKVLFMIITNSHYSRDLSFYIETLDVSEKGISFSDRHD